MVHNVAANTQTWITSPLLPLSTLSLATMRHDRAAIPALASAFRNCQWPFLAVSGVCALVLTTYSAPTLHYCEDKVLLHFPRRLASRG